MEPKLNNSGCIVEMQRVYCLKPLFQPPPPSSAMSDRQQLDHTTLHFFTCRRGNYLCLVCVRTLLGWILSSWVLYCATHLSTGQSGTKATQTHVPHDECLGENTPRIPWAHWEWLCPFLDDKALYEMCKNTGFNHSLRGRGSVTLRDPTRPWKHRGGGGGGDWGWST